MVANLYHEARGKYETARHAFEDASVRYDHASAEFQRAIETWQDAERWWNHARRLVVLAAAIDARNLDNFRGWRRADGRETFSCDRVSTATFRHWLKAEGWDLTGIHVDHVVPRSLGGGADHPLNYQLLDAHTNMSIGNKWDREKCGMIGRRCARAISVSKKCGTYDGPWF